MQKRQYIKQINHTLDKINRPDNLARIWLFADMVAESEVQHG